MFEIIAKRKGILLFIALLTIIYFPIFLHLTSMPLRMWDESVNGVNAIEMLHNHNYLVTYFYRKPNVELEPPLMIWCVVLLSKLMGFSELSLRLPSALAALALCIYLFYSLRRYTGNYLYGFFAVCILVTSAGFVRNHVIRTGEYDSLLVLFSTLFSLQIFWAAEAAEQKECAKHLFLFFVFLALAVLTKGPACLMQLPGIFIYVFIVVRLKIAQKQRYPNVGLRLKAIK